MKKIWGIVLVAVATSAFTIVADEWKKITVMDKVTVEMPGDPEDIDTKGGPQKIKNYSFPDSTELATILIDFTSLGVTEEMLEGLKETEEFKEQLKVGMAQGGVEVVAESEGMLNDKFFYYQFDLSTTKDEKKEISTNRMIFYKSYAITLGYKPGKNGENKELREKYFNSLVITE